MNFLQRFPGSYPVPTQIGGADPRRTSSFVVGSVPVLTAKFDRRSRSVAAMNASSGSIPSSKSEKNGAETDVQQSDIGADEKKSELYSNNMTQAMGAVLTYRHELGMNYDFILPDLIVGSCLQTPADVDKLRKIGVKTIFCLQQDPDLAYFDVDIQAIQEYAKCQDMKHYRAEIRDFDAFDLRMRLPTVVTELHSAIEQNGDITYIHCTAGLGRAPAVALAYMFWVRGHGLSEAHHLLMSKRPCFPKLGAIKSATADIIVGLSKNTIRLMWDGNGCSSVEVSGLDIGWGQRIPLIFDEAVGAWMLERELPEGRYEYKYIVDGKWTCNECELLTVPNSDGHVNNYVHVLCDGTDPQAGFLRDRLMSGDVDLSPQERKAIRDYLGFFKGGE